MTVAAIVGVFGVAGALLRFAVDSWFANRAALSAATTKGGTPRHWPWATLLVNVAGCLIIGLSIGITGRLGLGPEWRVAVATGLAGGLTTFSSWTTATVRLLGEARFQAAALNLGSNLLGGFVAAAVGIALAS
jgi:CrcB protein